MTHTHMTDKDCRLYNTEWLDEVGASDSKVVTQNNNFFADCSLIIKIALPYTSRIRTRLTHPPGFYNLHVGRSIFNLLVLDEQVSYRSISNFIERRLVGSVLVVEIGAIDDKEQSNRQPAHRRVLSTSKLRMYLQQVAHVRHAPRIFVYETRKAGWQEDKDGFWVIFMRLLQCINIHCILL